MGVFKGFSLMSSKAKCEEFLSNKITVENCCDLLILAHKHSAKHLKKEAMDSIIGMSAEVIETAGWKKLQFSHSEIMQEDTTAWIVSHSTTAAEVGAAVASFECSIQ